MARIAEIQERLRDAGIPGWLFYDHHLRDPLAYRILGFEAPRTPTRRWFYFIPAQGEPHALVHRIEPKMLDALPGKRSAYSSWQTLQGGLRDLLGDASSVAMQHSDNCEIPYIALVDGGMIDLVRSLGVKVTTSADLVQYFEARWSAAQLEMHLEAGRRVDRVRREAFQSAFDTLRANASTDEYSVAEFIRTRFREEGLITDHGPIVAVNANASNPHYEPQRGVSASVRTGDLLLIDMWAKLDQPHAVYYDITWTGYCGATPPDEMTRVFDVVKGGRDAGIRFVQGAIARKESPCGYEVDDAVRGHIRSHGLADYFVHRTGHSIGSEVHGNGANMDNLESHDTRRLIAGTCFSVEPGVYLEKFGIRSEINMYVGDSEAIVTGERQEELLKL